VPLTASLVDRIATAFAGFIERYGRFFRSRGHDNAPVAQRYLHGLAQAEAATFAAMATVVEDGCAQQFQHFISHAPWRHEPVIEQIGRDADRLLGGKPDSALILDESSFVKPGNRSLGVARQWCGRLGKVDNCQVAVFAVLTDGARHTPVDMRLYLPQRWIDDPARCDRAEIPPEARAMRSKTELALEMVRAARGMRFGWVGVDGGYGKEPAFLRALDDMGETFVADVHSDQRVWSEPPGLHIPAAKANRNGCPPSKPQAAVDGITVEKLVAGFGANDWTRCILRDSTRGPLRVDIAHRRVWVWDGEEATARCWHLVVRREVGAPKRIKYSLSNAPAETPLERLAQMQGARYWVERAFEDAKGECGLADYQAVGWRAWHHHVTMVMLAMLFIAAQRGAHQPGLALLTPRDIVKMLKETLPHRPQGKEALVDQINQRHARRRSAIQSRHRAQRFPAGRARPAP
jgi:SRSO17 transposase